MSFLKSSAVFFVGFLLVAAGASAEVEVIDFDRLPTGTILDEVSGSRGTGPIKITGYNERFGPEVNAAIIFDSENPTGDDFDLGTPNESFGDKDTPAPGRGRGGERGAMYENPKALGKLLIIAENLSDGDGDGLVDDPDDEGRFQSLKFVLDFSAVAPVTIYRMTLVDVEHHEKSPTVHLHDADDTLISSLDLPTIDDNGVVHIDFGPTEGVYKMVVDLEGSGAISSMMFEQEGPAIDVETLTNGNQADLVTDTDIPLLLIGGPVAWTYEVTNTGTEPLRGIEVTDDRGGAVSCPRDTLDSGESMECAASGLALDLSLADLGFDPVRGRCPSGADKLLYGNVGSVQALGTTSELAVSDSDPSHYCSSPPKARIYLRKQKKGPDTRAIASGGDATFKVVVWNNGTVDLTGIKVVDAMAPDCNREFGGLEVGRSTSYECTIPSLGLNSENVAGCTFVNEIVATGDGGGKTVTDSDTSTVELMSVTIDKTLQSASAETANFDISVTNNGCDLDSVRVTDRIAPDCERDLGALPAGESRSYTCSMPLENTACVEGARGEGSVDACDTAAYSVTSPVAEGGADGNGSGGEGSGGADAVSGQDGAEVAAEDGKGAPGGVLLVLLALLVAGGLFAWNRMKAG